MSRSTIGFFLLAVAVAAGAFFLFRRHEESTDPAPPRSLGALSRRSSPEEVAATTAAPAPTVTSAELLPPGENDADPAASDDGTGRVRGQVTRGGEPVALFQIVLSPAAGELTIGKEGTFEIRGVAPGDYAITVVADQAVGKSQSGVEILARKTTRADIDLEPGVRPAGRVEDANTTKPVADALIDFGGMVKVKTDAAGRFLSPFFVHPSALKTITVSHPEYDIATYNQMAIPDPNDFLLALGRGQGTIEGQIRGGIGLDGSTEALIRLYTDMGGSRFELRREIRQMAGLTYRFPNVRDGIHEVSVEFPGTDFPARRKKVHIYTLTPEIVNFDFQTGTTLEARLSARAIGVKYLGIELITPEGQPVASGTTNAEGVWRLTGVDPGTYHIKIGSGAFRFNTQAITITEGQPLCLVEIDCDQRRLKSSPK